MSNDDLTRRVFIKGIGYVSLGLVLGVVAGCDLDKLIETIKNRPIRRRLRTGSPEVDDDIDTYRDAVTAMKGRNDNLSWASQAAIHGTVASFTFCEHGTPHFFDWHRAYLLFFERICQKVTGKPKFGLPYWNWNQDPGIHSAFLDPASSLFLARTRTSMATHPSQPTGSTQLNTIFADTNFFSFGTQIEGTPHNSVHSFIGGTMGAGNSPLDPIFWPHHCMVDYCWAKWNLELGNDNTNDATWLNHDNSHFFNTDNNPDSAKAVATVLMPLLSYQYESSAIGSASATAAITTKSAYQKLDERIRRGADVRFEIKRRWPLSSKAAISIARPISMEAKVPASDFAGIVNSDTATERVFVSIQFAQLPPSSDFSVRVFVNHPAANSQTTNEDPHFAGSFAFFGTEAPPTAGTPEHKHQEPRFLVNVTDTLRRLQKAGQLRETSPLSIQLVAVPFAGKFEREDTQLLLNQIELIVTPVIIRSR